MFESMGRMRFQTWPVLIFAFSVMLLLMAFSAISNGRQSALLFDKWQSLTRSYQDSERSLQEIRSGVQVSGLLARDFLLDPSDPGADTYKKRLLENRTGMAKQLARLEGTISKEQAGKLKLLGNQLQAYWDSLEPVFAWNQQQRQSQSAKFLRDVVIPRREAAIGLAAEIERLNEANFRSRQSEIDAGRAQFGRFFVDSTVLLIAIALAVAFVVIVRVSQLEKSAGIQRERTEHAERELRDLSLKLVRAQEEERRAISRELHDEVGQMLTGLRMELSHLARFHSAPEEEFHTKIKESRILLEQTLQAVRDLAMGLRPSMLDDIGLGAALEWQAREFARRYDIPVNVLLEAPLEELTETQKTSIYRVVQEALTNCARHAHAHSIGIRLKRAGQALELAVADDGVGMQTDGRGNGLGLIGIQERIRELGGAFSILSLPKQGTTLAVTIPLREGS
jgi:signal transduction histidine kinase